jgi:eukaryotic-like serine/threonine-protein kinase
LNASANLLVVGESNGDVLGLDAATGATLWTFVTGGAVTAPAMVTGGTVYVGSNDHDLYALNQATGARRWTFVTGGPVQATPSLDNSGLLWVGSNDGFLYVVYASTGIEDFNFSIGSPIVGISSAFGIALFEDSTGTVGAQKTFLDVAGWRYPTGAGLVTVPVILDSAIFVGGGDGYLYAFTHIGLDPV